MADFDIDAARNQMTDDQIRSFINGSPRFEEGDRKRLLGKLDQANSTAPEFNSSNSAAPFLGNFLDEVMKGGSSMVQGVKNLFNVPDPDPNSLNRPGMLDRMFMGAGQDLRNQQQKAYQEVTSGQPLYGGMRAAVGGVVPMLGPDIMNILDKTFGKGGQQQDPGGATADALGALFNYGGDEIGRAIGGEVGKAGEGLYRSSMGFPKEVSRSDMKAASRVGLDLTLPRGNALGVMGSGEGSLEKLGKATDPNSMIGQAYTEAQKSLQPHLSDPVDYGDVFRPINKLIDKFDQAPRGREMADALRKERDQFLEDHGLVVKNAQGRTIRMNPLTVGKAQELKSAAYGILPNGMWSDTRDSWAPAAKEANRLLAQGMMEGIEKVVPGVAAPNKFMHDAITLSDALDAAEKTHSGFGIQQLLPLGLGVGVGSLGAAVHSPYAGPAALSAMALGHLMQNPATRSRIGLLMDKMSDVPMYMGGIPGLGRVGATMTPSASGVQVSSTDPEINKRLGLQAPPTAAAKVAPAPLDIPSLVQSEAKRQQVDPELAMAIANQESGMGRNTQDSPKGARGVMQLMEDTAKDLGVNRDKPESNIKGGVTYIKQLLKKYGGDKRKALAAYNFGPGNVDAGKDWPPETINYVDSILTELDRKSPQ